MKDITITFIKTIIASVIMSFVVYFIYFKLGVLFPDLKILKMVLLILSVGLGGLIYFVLCILFKIKEISELIRFKLAR